MDSKWRLTEFSIAGDTVRKEKYVAGESPIKYNNAEYTVKPIEGTNVNLYTLPIQLKIDDSEPINGIVDYSLYVCFEHRNRSVCIPYHLIIRHRGNWISIREKSQDYNTHYENIELIRVSNPNIAYSIPNNVITIHFKSQLKLIQILLNDVIVFEVRTADNPIFTGIQCSFSTYVFTNNLDIRAINIY